MIYDFISGLPLTATQMMLLRRCLKHRIGDVCEFMHESRLAYASSWCEFTRCCTLCWKHSEQQLLSKQIDLAKDVPTKWDLQRTYTFDVLSTEFLSCLNRASDCVANPNTWPRMFPHSTMYRIFKRRNTNFVTEGWWLEILHACGPAAWR